MFETLASEILSKNRCLMVPVFNGVGRLPDPGLVGPLLLGKIDRLAQSKLWQWAVMNQLPSTVRLVRSVSFLVAGCAAFCLAFYPGSTLAGATENSLGDPKPIHALTEIQCITPDGHVSPLLGAPRPTQNAPATVKADDTISCPLREGETVFIIAFPKIALLDRLTFVNENATACGELNIAVSNYRLPANSPSWTTVDGAIPFARKRLFNLSMLGVEARYVKLSFRVQKPGNISTPIARSSEDLRFGYINLEMPAIPHSTRD
jgi:hypothetical protein